MVMTIPSGLRWVLYAMSWFVIDSEERAAFGRAAFGDNFAASSCLVYLAAGTLNVVAKILQLVVNPLSLVG